MSDVATVAERPDISSGEDRVRALLNGAIGAGTSRALKANEPKNLRPVHKKIIALSAAGVANNEIAKMLELSESWVSVVLNHPEAQDIRNEMTTEFVMGLHGDTRQQIEASTAEAQQVILSLMRGATKENIKLLAAKDVLDRGGFKPKERVEVTRLSLNSADALLITEALRESRTEVVDLPEAEITSDLSLGRDVSVHAGS